MVKISRKIANSASFNLSHLRVFFSNMDSSSENDSDFELHFEESETDKNDDDDVPVVERLWTNVR